MNVLFVCTENLVRSRIAERLFRELQGDRPRHGTRAVGTAWHAPRRLTTRDLAWADLVAVMEPAHRELIRKHWPHHADRIEVIGISNHFLAEEHELRATLEPRLRALLARCDGGEDGRADGRGGRAAAAGRTVPDREGA